MIRAVFDPEWEYFHRIFNRLTHDCPAPKPVVLQRPYMTSWGLTEYYSDATVVSIAAHLDENLAVEVLMHEWAHALLYDPYYMLQHPWPAHGEEWGKAYARVYAAAIEQNYEYPPYARRREKPVPAWSYFQATK